MHSELTNLLPDDRTASLRRDYFIRLATLATSALVVLVLIDGALLIPSYVYLHGEVDARTAQLTAIESNLASSDEAALETRLKTLSANAALLSSLANVSSGSATIGDALSIATPGVMLSGFMFTPSQGSKPGTLLISGTADTRDHLRAYQLALQSASFAKSADLPISAYAKDTDIVFSITVTLDSTP